VEQFDDLVSDLRLPAIAAPMTSVSTPELVAEACAAGIVGSFPTSNAKSIAQLDEWFDQIETRRATVTGQQKAGPIAANLIVGKQNKRLDEDVEQVVKWQPNLVITSVGSPAPVVGPLQEAGCLVLADVVSEAHAHKALAAGVDGLILLSAGAGGHTGWANPFAFVRSVRSFFDGPLVLTGGMSDGAALWAAICAGCNMAMFGTRFIATEESATPDAWLDALQRSTMDDITLITAPNGVVASALPDDAGSAGHTVSAVRSVQTVAQLVDEIETGWVDARRRTGQLLGNKP
jgi:nitronate monooxygenase